MLIWPAIDLLGGRCVRLRQGDFGQQSTYDGDPIEIAKEFAGQGADGIHVVDLDGAKTGAPAHLAILEGMARSAGVAIEFGGGMRSVSAVRGALDAGAARVVLGTRIARDAEFASEVFSEFGDSVVAGIDSSAGRVAVSGWIEQTDLDEVEFARSLQAMGCIRAIVTDISRDGMMAGPNLEQLKRMSSETELKIIASGGIGSLADIAILADANVEGAIIGRALYEGAFTVAQAAAEAQHRSDEYGVPG